jgi:hypothetical protein
VIAPVYVVAVDMTQNSCAPPLAQSLSDVQPDALQNPAEQMLAGGPQLLSLSQATWQTLVTHCARGLPSDCTQSASAMQPAAWQRWTVALHVVPDAQSRSLAHLK